MGGGSSKGTKVRQGTPGFDEVLPGASAAFKHTERQLGELKRHQDDLDRQKDAVEAAIAASLKRLEIQTSTQLMGMTFLKQVRRLSPLSVRLPRVFRVFFFLIFARLFDTDRGDGA